MGSQKGYGFYSRFVFTARIYFTTGVVLVSKSGAVGNLGLAGVARREWLGFFINTLA